MHFMFDNESCVAERSYWSKISVTCGRVVLLRAGDKG